MPRLFFLHACKISKHKLWEPEKNIVKAWNNKSMKSTCRKYKNYILWINEILQLCELKAHVAVEAGIILKVAEKPLDKNIKCFATFFAPCFRNDIEIIA